MAAGGGGGDVAAVGVVDGSVAPTSPQSTLKNDALVEVIRGRVDRVGFPSPHNRNPQSHPDKDHNPNVDGVLDMDHFLVCHPVAGQHLLQSHSHLWWLLRSAHLRLLRL